MEHASQHRLNDDRIGRLLFKLTLPAFLGMFVITLYNVVDTIFIGHYIGSLGIAGLSIVFPVQMLSLGLGQLIGIGAGSLMSRLMGASNTSRAEHALGNALTLSCLLSVLLVVVGLSRLNFWLIFLGASDLILPYARDYMSIILFGMLFQILAMSLNGLIRAEGNTIVPMIGMSIGAGINIVLDAVFIISLNWGIKGAALATVLGQLISVAYLMRYYASGNSFLKIRLNKLRLDLIIVRDIFAIGVASFARTLSTSVSGVIVNNLLVSYGGEIAVSVYGILIRITMFVLMPGISIGQGLQPILGFNYGAGHYDRAIRVIKVAIIAASTFCLAVFVALYFYTEPIIAIFTRDQDLIQMTAYAGKKVFLVIYLIGFMMVGSLTFQSIGKAVQSFVTSISRTVLFLIPLLLILPRFWQIEGIWWAFPISDILTFLLTLILLTFQMRELRQSQTMIVNKQTAHQGEIA